MNIGGSKLQLFLRPPFLFFVRILINICSKWRNNDKKDGYLNWEARTIIPTTGGTKNKLSLIHD